MKNQFKKSEIALIEAAVREAEAKTSGEIVPVVQRASGDYSWVRERMGLLGLMAGTVTFCVVSYSHPFSGELPALLWLQGIGFLAGWFCGVWPAFVRIALSKTYLAEEVHESAMASFLRNGLTETKDRTGILI